MLVDKSERLAVLLLGMVVVRIFFVVEFVFPILYK